MRDTYQDVLAAGINRRTLLKYAGAVGAATALTASLAACTGQSVASATKTAGASGAALGTAAKPQGTITATAAFQLSSGFDPMNASSAVATAVNQHILEALVDLDPITRVPYAALAKSMPKSTDGGSTWSATLRDGAKFSDGTPVTADDVAWSFMRIIDPANKALLAPFLTFLVSAKATSSTTVEFILSQPFSLFPERSAVVKIIPKAKTADAATSLVYNSTPIGSGPFKLDSASPTTGVVMSNNTNYNGPRPALVTSIVLRTSADNTARLNDLQGGLSQAIEAVPYLNAASLASPDKDDVKQAFNMLFLMFNCSEAPFTDKRVRQALFYAIDPKKLIATALSGYGSPATSYLDEANSDYQKASTVYSYNPTKAKSLLAAAGVKNLSFELLTTNTAFVSDSAPILAEAWKAIGVTATVNTVPSATAYNTVGADQFKVLAASGDPTVYGPDTDLLLRWFYASDTWMTSRARWTDPTRQTLTGLINRASTQTGAAQKATWKQALDLLSEEVPLYPVFHAKIITGYDSTKLTDFHGAATTGLYFLGVGRTK